MAKRVYALWGNAGHAKVLGSAIHALGGSVAAIFDRNASAVSVLPDVPLFIGMDGFRKWVSDAHDLSRYNGLVAIGGGRGRDRVTIGERFREAGLSTDPFIHPRAFVCQTARLGAGSQVLALACLAADASVGNDCILNHRAAVDHECTIGDGVHIAPGATLCGCVVVERFAFIAAGAVILPRLRIGEGSIVGAGAVVTHDVPAGVVVIGNPARITRLVQE